MNTKNIAITAIIALITAGAGFYGGTVYQKNVFAQQRSQRFSGNGPQNGQPRSFGGGRQGGPNGNGMVAGQITAKDDKSITVKMRDGSSKIVLFSDSTSVGKAVSGSSLDLADGQNVIVAGTPNSDGSVSAQNIQIRPDQPNGNSQN